MSKSATVPIAPRHYQAICGLALAAIFVIQLQQNIHLALNGMLLFLGSVSILYRIRISPLFVFLAFAGGQLQEQINQNQFFNPDMRPFRFLDLADILLCVATLAYVVGHYRLHGLWFNVLPEDVREAPASSGPSPRLAVPSQARSEASMTADELAWLVIPIPVFAVAAELCVRALKQHWALVDLPPRWRQFLVVTWILLVVMFVTTHLFRYWRRAQMDRAAAQLLLQDVLWHETRGEQRRLSRWLVWRKLKRQEEG